MKKQLLLLGLAAFALGACQKNSVQQSADKATENASGLAVSSTPGTLLDPDATAETKNLYHNLRLSSWTGVFFGHQDDRVIGIDSPLSTEWSYDTPHGTHQLNSDVEYLVNEYPAVNGYEMGNIELGTLTYNNDGVPFRWIAKTARAIYSQGGILSIVWGCRNPVYPQWDKKAHSDSGIHNTIAHFFDGSNPNHAQYVARYQGYMDKFAQFVKDSLKGPNGEAIPILFRTLHEQNGGWFWWGATETTAFDYKKFWKYTVDYLKNTAHLHNLIYVYAPSSFTTTSPTDTTAYLATYAGNSYVDVISADIYDSPSNGPGVFKTKASAMVAAMKTKATVSVKPFSISETGLNLVPDSLWWTNTFKPIVKGKGMAYAVVWRNTRSNNSPLTDSYYCAYKGQVSAKNFRLMHQDTTLYFLTKAQARHMYQP